MSNEMKVFESSEFGSVRVVEVNNEPWFVAIDVAKSLGYVNTRDAVIEHCKKVNKFKESENATVGFIDKIGTQPNLIPESDVYRLVMRSCLPSAEQFQDWVVEEVLPSIRKTGGYLVSTPDDTPETLLARAVLVAQETIQRVERERDESKRTKAMIGSRREATAMATASAAVRKAKDLEVKANDLEAKADGLEEQLGIAGGYRTVKSIKWLSEIFDVSNPAAYSQIEKALNKLSKNMNHEAVKIDDPKYGSVNGYHVDVIKEFHVNVMEYKSILEKYRR